MKKKFFYLYILIGLLNCRGNDKSQTDFIVRNFNPIANYKDTQNSDNKDLLTMKLDYTDAISNGFIIPSVRQTDDGMFHFEFEIKNIKSLPQKFFYKIYFSNSNE